MRLLKNYWLACAAEFDSISKEASIKGKYALATNATIAANFYKRTAEDLTIFIELYDKRLSKTMGNQPCEESFDGTLEMFDAFHRLLRDKQKLKVV